MLDSNMVIAVALAAGEGIRRRMGEHDEGDFVMSAIAYAEVFHGTLRGRPPNLPVLQAIVDQVPVLPFDASAAARYAALSFRRASYDQLIAAHALSLGLTLVSHNAKHFASIPGLTVESWLDYPQFR